MTIGKLTLCTRLNYRRLTSLQTLSLESTLPVVRQKATTTKSLPVRWDATVLPVVARAIAAARYSSTVPQCEPKLNIGISAGTKRIDDSSKQKRTTIPECETMQTVTPMKMKTQRGNKMELATSSAMADFEDQWSYYVGDIDYHDDQKHDMYVRLYRRLKRKRLARRALVGRRYLNHYTD